MDLSLELPLRTIISLLHPEAAPVEHPVAGRYTRTRILPAWYRVNGRSGATGAWHPARRSGGLLGREDPALLAPLPPPFTYEKFWRNKYPPAPASVSDLYDSFNFVNLSEIERKFEIPRFLTSTVEGIWGTFAESNFWIKNLNKTPLNFLKQSSQVNNFTVFFQFFIGMWKSVFSICLGYFAIPRTNKFGLEN